VTPAGSDGSNSSPRCNNCLKLPIALCRIAPMVCTRSGLTFIRNSEDTSEKKISREWSKLTKPMCYHLYYQQDFCTLQKSDVNVLFDLQTASRHDVRTIA